MAASANNNINGLLEMANEVIKPNFVIAEIGSFSGVSTELFSLFTKTVHVIDHWQPTDHEYIKTAENEFDKMLTRVNNVVKHKIDSVEGAQLFPDECFDLVYIDGDHNYESVVRDLNAWYPKVKMGGYLAGHDYNIESVFRAVNEKVVVTKVYSDDSWLSIRNN
jgi:cephalosporin hydroxylase